MLEHHHDELQHHEHNHHDHDKNSADAQEHSYNHHDSHGHSHNQEDEHNHSGGCACSSDEGILSDIGKEEERSKEPYYKIGFGIAAFVIAYILNQMSFASGAIYSSHNIAYLLYVVMVLYVGYDTIYEGIEGALHGKVRIELLMIIAVVGAFLLNSAPEGALLILLYYISEFLEDLSIDKSKKSISNLVKLSPDTAIVKVGDKEEERNVDDISVGEIVIVKPGDKIPVDGEIIKGSTSVNQASITGESLAVSKDVGDEVYSSTINEEGYIEVQVTKSSNNTVFAKIVDLIKESEDKKAHIDIFVDKFATYYTPSIVVLAILVACIPTFMFNQPFQTWAYRALCLLVISCPCAVAISTPVSMISSITAGTNHGIIIKGGEYIEELANTKSILFDKTGTLTEGNLKIDTINPIDDFNSEQLIKIGCSIENQSKHPIANTFNEYKKENHLELYDVDDFKSISGKGLQGSIKGVNYYIGNKELFNFNKGLKSELNSINADEGKTLIIIGTEDKILGSITLNDKIREETPSTIDFLKSKDIKTMMITGDNNKTAELVSKEIGLDGYYSDLLPEDKVDIVEKLVEKDKHVAMVGDGVNDAPSLAMSNVGIAMGMGSDVAIDTGDIVLMNDEISKLSYLISLARKTMQVVKTNITVAVAVKAILAVVAILGFVSLWEAITIGDVGLTLLVVAYGLRLSKF